MKDLNISTFFLADTERLRCFIRPLYVEWLLHVLISSNCAFPVLVPQKQSWLINPHVVNAPTIVKSETADAHRIHNVTRRFQKNTKRVSTGILDKGSSRSLELGRFTISNLNKITTFIVNPIVIVVVFKIFIKMRRRRNVVVN